MLYGKVRLAALAGCAVSVLVIAGCGAREPVEAPPASAELGGGATETPELMGGPPAAETTPADGLLGDPETTTERVPPPTPVYSTNPNLRTWRRPDGALVTAMAPIPNPKGSRRSVRYAPHAEGGSARRAHAAPMAAAHPAARPAAVAKPLPVAKPAPKPVTVAAAPAPVKPVIAAKPAGAPTKAPIVAPLAPVPAAKPAPAKPQTKLETLQAAVAPEATRGANLATAESLAQGKEGQVTLALPATLGDLIKTEAAKLGLGKAAKKTSAYADLQGQGYEITPNGRQTAVVKSGEPATFAWQVKPTADAKGPLKTDFGVELNGAKPGQGFTLGSISKQVAPIQDAVSEKTKGLKFAMPSLGRYETVDVPGVGKVAGKSLLGGALVLLALLILVAISRNASAAKARTERRRKFRTLTDYGRNEMDFDTPRPADVNYVNPMVAAAGGALAGAAVATAAHHHGDHRDGQGHDDQNYQAPPRAEHNPFETPPHHSHADHQDHPVAPTAAAEPPSVSAHDPEPEAAVDHVHDDHGHAAPDHHADQGHGHDDHAARKELEPTH